MVSNKQKQIKVLKFVYATYFCANKQRVEKKCTGKSDWKWDKRKTKKYEKSVKKQTKISSNQIKIITNRKCGK